MKDESACVHVQVPRDKSGLIKIGHILAYANGTGDGDRDNRIARSVHYGCAGNREIGGLIGYNQSYHLLDDILVIVSDN